MQALSVDARRPKKERRTARMLFQEIKASGYNGCYSRVTDFIRAWRQGEGKAVSKSAFVPLQFELGEAFQFDWSEDGLVVGGIYRKLQVSHMKLCASRAFWLVAYPSQGHEMLFDAHTRSFAAFGGVARRGIYDNMKTAVDKVHNSKGRTVNSRFAVMCAHYLFDADFCNVASGWEKGVVEKNVQDSHRRIWIEAREQRFGSFADLNAWLASRCRSLWEQVKHPDYRELSIADVFEQERAHLMPMPTSLDGYVERAARVSSTWLVVIGRNRYLHRLIATDNKIHRKIHRKKFGFCRTPVDDIGRLDYYKEPAEPIAMRVSGYFSGLLWTCLETNRETEWWVQRGANKSSRCDSLANRRPNQPSCWLKFSQAPSISLLQVSGNVATPSAANAARHERGPSLIQRSRMSAQACSIALLCTAYSALL